MVHREHLGHYFVATGTLIISRLFFSHHKILSQLIITGAIAALTICGKAAGMGIAISHSREIVFTADRLLHFFRLLSDKDENNASK